MNKRIVKKKVSFYSLKKSNSSETDIIKFDHFNRESSFANFSSSTNSVPVGSFRRDEQIDQVDDTSLIEGHNRKSLWRGPYTPE